MEIIKEEFLEEMLFIKLSERIMNGAQEIVHEVIECAH